MQLPEDIDPTAALVHLEAIRRLKAQYFRCVDLKLFDELAGLFVEDATVSYGGGLHSFAGREAIIGFFRESMSSPQMLTSHRGAHSEIDLVSAREATATWGFDDRVVMVDLGLMLVGSGFYDDRYVLGAHGWKIAHTGYKRTFEYISRLPEGFSLTGSYFETDGRSTLG